MTKPRKGEKYTPKISILLRDAQPTWQEIDGEPDPKKSLETERRRDIGIDELITIYRESKRGGRVDPRVELFCKLLKKRNGGKLPRRKGGRPPDEHKKLLIAVAVAEALAAQTGKRKSVTQAVRHVHKTFVFNRKPLTVPEATIRDYYYDSDPEWQEAIKVELACRRLPVTEPVPEQAPVSVPVDLTEPSWIAAQRRPGTPVPPFVAFGPSGEPVRKLPNR
jgi:hypothetical protein